METIQEAAKEYAEALNYTMEAKHNMCPMDFEIAFKKGVDFAQRWIPIEEELPDYYKPIIGAFFITEILIEAPLSVWRGWSDISNGDIYTVMGTDIIADGKPTKWRPIEIK